MNSKEGDNDSNVHDEINKICKDYRKRNMFDDISKKKKLDN